MSDVVGVTCGLDRLAERRARIDRLIDELDDNDFRTREAAHHALMAMGPAVERELEERQDGASAECARRLKLLLDHFSEMREAFDIEAPQPWRRDDALATPLFTATGKLQTTKLELEGAFGTVSLPLDRVKSVRRLPELAMSNAFRRTTVQGTHLVDRQSCKTKVTVQKGDVVCVSADGMIHRNGSSTSVSTPDGSTRLGTYALGSQKRYGGVLLARVGPQGEWRIVGGKGRFTADDDGELELAIGMSSTYATRYTYTGQYDVAVFIKRDR